MIEKMIAMLGQKAEDRVTGFKGTIATVSFDLYGCAQVWITPEVTKEGKLESGNWFDVNRIKLSATRVLEAPTFDLVKLPEDYQKGPAEKCAPRGA